ncbi:MAG: GAF domain-containing protein [Acidobacteriota bacterium]|nr:GAF domain-containing protein [Acidobacteriota bacterium]
MNRKTLHVVFNSLFGIGGFCNAILFPIVLETQPDSLAQLLKAPVNFLRQRLWWLWPASFLLAALAKFADKKICDRWGHDAVKEMLEILREKGFPGNKEPVHFHRVTLFKHKRWWLCWRFWPWSGWLVPVVRSGHTTLNHQTCFLAPDEADHAEGIAGRCWSTKAVILIPTEDSNMTLPLLNPEVNAKPHDPHAMAEIYAKETFMDTDWVLKKLPHSRSFLGIPVVVQGQPWGVIVVDSRATKIQCAKGILASYEEIARPFIKCLERLS